MLADADLAISPVLGGMEEAAQEMLPQDRARMSRLAGPSRDPSFPVPRAGAARTLAGSRD